jgi:NAD(P)-dependent dehydrogenase (short-subunit alcohol dehydrogenase family)
VTDATLERRLEGKVALVTGAGSEGPLAGIGMAIAAVLARHGARVSIADLASSRAENTQSYILAEGGESMVTIGDITDEAACKRMVEETLHAFGTLNVLVNSAAVVAGGSVMTTERTEWDRCIAVNLTSVMLMSKYAIPYMNKAGGGSIVNISSIAALRAMGAGAYAASKGGMISLTKDMAFWHGRDGIRVNCIAPGYVYTPMGSWGGPAVRELHRRCVLLNSEGTPWDIAHAALFLSSEESRWVTGVTLPVDGGTTASTIQESWPWLDELDDGLARLRGARDT